jgi:hypothetical protein
MDRTGADALHPRRRRPRRHLVPRVHPVRAPRRRAPVPRRHRSGGLRADPGGGASFEEARRTARPGGGVEPVAGQGPRPALLGRQRLLFGARPLRLEPGAALGGVGPSPGRALGHSSGRGETAIRSASSTASATRLSRRDRTSAEPTAGRIERPVEKGGGLSHRRLALIAAALAALALAAVLLMRPRRPEPPPRAAGGERSAQGAAPAEPPRAAPEPAAALPLGAKPAGEAPSSEQEKAEPQLAERGVQPSAEPEASAAKAPPSPPTLPPSAAKPRPARPVERQRPTVDLFTEPQ